MPLSILKFCSLLLLGAGLLACEEPKTAPPAGPYKGPIEEIDNVRLLYSEAATLKVKLTTARQLRYLNDDKKFPEEVNIVFYGPAGEEVTTLRSDSGRYDKARDLYTVMGHVKVFKKDTREELQTPELHWNPNSKKVYTEKRVAVNNQLTGEKLYGLGMDADQDFSRYAFRQVTGQFNVEAGF